MTSPGGAAAGEGGGRLTVVADSGAGTGAGSEFTVQAPTMTREAAAVAMTAKLDTERSCCGHPSTIGHKTDAPYVAQRAEFALRDHRRQACGYDRDTV